MVSAWVKVLASNPDKGMRAFLRGDCCAKHRPDVRSAVQHAGPGFTGGDGVR
ncbi:MAG: hypothetical protein AMXMBFR76_20010 [Pseudomonadota bacterium]